MKLRTQRALGFLTDLINTFPLITHTTSIIRQLPRSSRRKPRKANSRLQRRPQARRGSRKTAPSLRYGHRKRFIRISADFLQPMRLKLVQKSRHLVHADIYRGLTCPFGLCTRRRGIGRVYGVFYRRSGFVQGSSNTCEDS